MARTELGKLTVGRSPKSGPRADWANARIIQRNLIYVIGLAPAVAYEDTLRKDEYFGQYGKVMKIVVNRDKPFNPPGQSGPTYSAYITYANDREASLAILAVDGASLHGCVIHASYGTTKYCSSYVRDLPCNNADCLYLHARAKPADVVSRDLCKSKELFREHHDAVLEHLAKVPSKPLLPRCVQSKPVLPCLTSAIEKLNDYLKKTTPVKPKIEAFPEKTLSKWEAEAPPVKSSLHLTAVRSTPQPAAKDEDFPTLSQVVLPKRLLSALDETATSGNQSTDAHRDRDFDLCLASLSSLDRLVFERLKAARDASLKSKGPLMAQILEGQDTNLCGADKAMQFFVDQLALTPKQKPSDIPAQAIVQSEVKQQKAGFKLFEQQYSMRFDQSGNIYRRLDRRLDQRLLKKQSAEAKAASSGLS